ncbi:PEP/pyruvate-binding domain-containing protein [Salidesulfovibrio onnuriiensis]|uniref:PEP/pyruvate-binding domain-containing protein n=1 Tax=Salidesulfovibrio onnuriiensis TaxID=2583823 RepID=UPI0011CAE361|nr:PEP/pyruvate-binding domain-containing protein [Salidesulfovibrio onnuriiensis]
MNRGWDFCAIGGSESKFRTYHDLMAHKVRDILLISTPYDAWVMEEDCKLSERIVSEYRGLNLSHPPRLTWVSSVAEALAKLDERRYDLVIHMPQLQDMEDVNAGRAIKEKDPAMPIILLTHRDVNFPEGRPPWFDRHFVWSGDADLLVALVKLTEDAWNVDFDTRSIGIRVIIFVEDSPRYISSLLPILYKELVLQTQKVIEVGLNQEHRLLTMRARPKILLAETYEQAVQLFHTYEEFVQGVISDVRFPMNGSKDPEAGVRFLRQVKEHRQDIPLLMASNEPRNKGKAARLPAFFVDKNSPLLLADVQRFVSDQLGFGDFIFRRPDGTEIARAGSLYVLEKLMRVVPDDVFLRHCRDNDFSRWFFARTEFDLACKVRPLTEQDFTDVDNMRTYLVEDIGKRRKERQKGVIVNFNPKDFDPATDFMKIGEGSLGGKARGLAFLFALLDRAEDLETKFSGRMTISAPRTLTMATQCFDEFVTFNDLKYLADKDVEDGEVARIFELAEFPGWIREQLRAYLMEIEHPLAVRSSSLLEDAQFQAYAGLYSTFMLPNDHPDIDCRLDQLVHAVKMVFASTYFKAPKAFSRRVNLRTDEERMGVIIQEIVGERYGDYFYPAMGGVAQSYNYYPFGRMKPEEGVASVAMGLGKTVVDGEKCLRFSPRYPKVLPQCPTMEETLKNAQNTFFSLHMPGECTVKSFLEGENVVRRDVTEAEENGPLSMLASTYLPEQGILRDTAAVDGPKVMVFAPVLKHKAVPLAEVLGDVLEVAQEAMGGPVEIEFAVNMYADGRTPEFSLLQVRPMSALADLHQVTIEPEDMERAFCYSEHALGNAEKSDIRDIVYVRPDAFDAAKTEQIAREIGEINVRMVEQGRKYLLIGPGRWGSSDRWLGIPVGWADISGVSAIIETWCEELRVEPSQGSHFFHNITTLGINYVMVPQTGESRLDWDWITSIPAKRHGEFLAVAALDEPCTVKVDGRQSRCVMLPG